MRGAECVEQQHALPGLAQVPGGPGAEHAGADDDGIPAGFVHLRVLRCGDARAGEAGGQCRSDCRAARDALLMPRIVSKMASAASR